MACLFTGLSEHPNTKIGLIIGNGFNISFLNKEADDTYTVINSELGELQSMSVYIAKTPSQVVWAKTVNWLNC